MITDVQKMITETTVPYRKGAVVRTEDVGGVTVTHVDGYPETPSRGVLVDVHFINVGFTEAVAAWSKESFLRLVEDSAKGCHCDVTLDRLAQGPTYIELGGWLGSQELALRFIALGAHLECWPVITPATLGLEGPDADQLAGMGMVMNGGLSR